MSAPPEHRGSPQTGTVHQPSGIAWPITTDTGQRGPRADLLAALITVVGGATAIGQLFLSWSSVVPGVGLPGGPTGRARFSGRGAGLSLVDNITFYSIAGTALAGTALVLLGLAMLLPVDHRPLGAVALTLSVACLLATGWWLVRGHQTFDQSLGDLFVHAGPGWYLFIVSGPIGIFGSAKALATG